MSTSSLQRTEQPTTLAVAQLDARAGRTYRFYTEATSAPLLTPRRRCRREAAVLVTGGLGLVLEPMATAIESIVLAAGPDVLVVVDLNCRPPAIADRDVYVARLGRVLARADVVKASDEDLRVAAPRRGADRGRRRALDAGGRASCW